MPIYIRRAMLRAALWSPIAAFLAACGAAASPTATSAPAKPAAAAAAAERAPRRPAAASPPAAAAARPRPSRPGQPERGRVPAAGCGRDRRVRRRDAGRRQHGRRGRPVRPGRGAKLRADAGADRGPVLRRREAQPLRHPQRPEQRRDQGGPAADADAARPRRQRQRLRADRGRPGRRLALRRRGRLLRHPGPRLRQHQGPEVPARLPGDRRERDRQVHDDLPGLVPGPGDPHPLQDPHRPGLGEGQGADVPVLLRRGAQQPGLHERLAVLEQGRPAAARPTPRT